jgi:hypothetical protein
LRLVFEGEEQSCDEEDVCCVEVLNLGFVDLVDGYLWEEEEKEQKKTKRKKKKTL